MGSQCGNHCSICTAFVARHETESPGLEIGPGCAPIAPKKQGFHVHVLDHCDKKALIEKYRPLGINEWMVVDERGLRFGEIAP